MCQQRWGKGLRATEWAWEGLQMVEKEKSSTSLCMEVVSSVEGLQRAAAVLHCPTGCQSAAASVTLLLLSSTSPAHRPQRGFAWATFKTMSDSLLRAWRPKLLRPRNWMHLMEWSSWKLRPCTSNVESRFKELRGAGGRSTKSSGTEERSSHVPCAFRATNSGSGAIYVSQNPSKIIPRGQSRAPFSWVVLPVWGQARSSLLFLHCWVALPEINRDPFHVTRMSIRQGRFCRELEFIKLWFFAQRRFHRNLAHA